MNTLYIIRILGSRCSPGRGPYSSHPLQNCRALASLGNTQPPLSSLIRQGGGLTGFLSLQGSLTVRSRFTANPLENQFF